MRRLIVTDFLTLDGVIEAPGMEEHRDGRNGWALQRTSDDLEDYNASQIAEADAILLGRTTYQLWAAFWPTATGADALKARLDEIPKFVVSNTLKQAAWPGTVIVSGDMGENHPDDWDTAKGIIKWIKAPVYYAPGNHDVRSNDVDQYRRAFGKDYYTFRVKTCSPLLHGGVAGCLHWGPR